jgi:hypothetical protein
VFSAREIKGMACSESYSLVIWAISKPENIVVQNTECPEANDLARVFSSGLYIEE